MNDTNIYTMGIFWMLVYFFMGCGEDSSAPPAVVTPTQSSTTAFTGEAIQAKWKAVCIDGNQSTIDATYTFCMQYPTTLIDCAANKDLNKKKLDKTWIEIAATAMANYDQCNTDPRVDSTYCQGKYEEEIAFEVNLKCEEAATWY